MKNLPLWVATAAFPLAFFSGIASAQNADPPSRVARIAYLNGPVSFEPASVDEWADASLNYPMTTGDNLYTDNGARAVLRIGQNAIRLDAGTNFQFVHLNDNIVQTSINSGSLNVHVKHLFDGESWEIDTPNGAVTLLRTGQYRVDTDTSRDATMVTVRSGDIQVTANDQSFPVHSGQTAYFDNSGNPPDVQDANQPDEFDSFIASRDRIEDAPPPQYVSPDMVGYEDLNGNGDWRNTPDYGPVWTPRVAAGWTPYHDGRWAWVEPWGWTWIDDAPWGFAPFHYGRWANIDNRWSWCPGPVAARVYYAPALVAFVGGGGFGVGVSVGGGGGGLVGWFPLGPREPYYPSYHVSETYIRQVNVTNTRITNINVTNINVTKINYVNRTSVVAVPQRSFASAQPVQRSVVRVQANQIRQAQVIGAAPRVAPQRESIVASVTRKAAPPPAAVVSRAVVAKIAPPPRAVPFAAKQQMLQQHPGRPVAPAQIQTLRAEVARQNPTPTRPQVQTINTKQVRAVTPTVRSGPAPTFAQRPAQRPGQPQSVPRQPANQAQPVVRPQNAPPAPAQTPARPATPPAREQAQPPARQVPPTRDQVQPPARQVPPTREQPQPPARQVPPTREQTRPPARPATPAPAAREQAQPPVRQAPPAREQAQPPARPATPATREQAQPPVRQAPPTREQAQPPVRQSPPPREQAQPPVHQSPPPREQAQPARQAPAAREQATPPARQAPPQRAEPPVHPAPPARPQAQPQRQAPPPEHRQAPPAKREEKKHEEK